MTVLAYDEAKIGPWWSASSGEFSKIDKLTVLSVSDASVEALAAMASRNMKLAVTIQDGTVWVSDDDRHNAQIDLVRLKEENQKYLNKKEKRDDRRVVPFSRSIGSGALQALRRLSAMCVKSPSRRSISSSSSTVARSV